MSLYPKVKVRAAELDDDDDPFWNFNSLSINIKDIAPPGKECKKASSASISKAPKSYIPRAMTPPHPLQKVSQMTTTKKTEEGIEKISNPQIRARSAPRPRAVISSPDNDQILRSRNKMMLERPSTVKSHNTAQNKHLGMSRSSEGRCSSSTSPWPWKPLKRDSKSKETAHTSGNAKGKNGSVSDVRVPRANILKSKPCFTIK